MNVSNSRTELLLEEGIISQEEKVKIIESVDADFENTFSSEDGQTSFSEISMGLKFSLLISVSILFLTFVFLFFYLRSISQEIDDSSTVFTQEFGDSEWKILNHFKLQSDQVLSSKNREILIYQDKISEYDNKLTALRELIISKREIENLLEIEGVRLRESGLDQNEILRSLEQLEINQITALSPLIAENYDLSLNEINKEIDRLLDEKSSNEEQLNQKLQQREELIAENNRLQQEIEKSQDIIHGSFSSDTLNLNKETAFSADDKKILSQFKEMAVWVDVATGTKDKEKYEEAVLNLRTLVDSLPSIAKTFSLLQIDDEVIEPIESPSGPRLLGKISNIRFNIIEIIPMSYIRVERGTSFTIIRKDVSDQGIELGKGQITSTTPLEGQIMSLSNTQFKPGVDDNVYIEE